ncbi:MAG: Fe-S cluster assembly sulfur transfer protein SufU [Anaerolineaceae bacterium]
MTLPEPQFDDLYREVILDHYRRPRNRGSLAEATRTAEGVNPVCGDEITLELLINDHMIEGVAFSGQGCAISLASASMLTERIKGNSTVEAIRVLGEVRAMLVNGEAPSSDLGDLEALEGVARLPVRVKCALLCWNVLQQGLDMPANVA